MKIKLVTASLLLALTGCLDLQPILAAEIAGVVRATAGSNVNVTLQGGHVPATGDNAEIYFKLPDGEEPITVATGKVDKIDGHTASIKIESATGEVREGHLARISSEHPQVRRGEGVADVTSSGPPLSSASAAERLAGTWIDPLQKDTLIELRADGTVSTPIDPENRISMIGKFTIDASRQPVRVEGGFEDYAIDPEVSEEAKREFTAAREKAREVEDFKGRGLADVRRAKFIGEFDGTDRMRVWNFMHPSDVRSDPLGPPNSILVRSPAPGAPPPTGEAAAASEAQAYAELIAGFTSAIAIDPDNAELYVKRAALRMLKRELSTVDDIIADATRALALGANEPEAAYQLRGAANVLKGNYAAGFDDFTALLASDADNADVLETRAFAAMELGRWKEVLKDASKVIKLKPKSANGHLLVGCYYANAGAKEAAEGAWKKALAYDPLIEGAVKDARQRFGAKKPGAGKRKP